MNEVKPRQLKLLERKAQSLLPKEAETEVLDLLVQLLKSVIPALAGGSNDEQDH
jgi:hypothetical protein